MTTRGKTYGFSESDANELLQKIGNGDTEFPEVRPRGIPNTSSSGLLHCMTPAGGIPAMSGLQMGSAECEIYDCSDTGLLSLGATAADVYNPLLKIIPGGKRILAAWNTAGLLVAVSFGPGLVDVREAPDLNSLDKTIDGSTWEEWVQIAECS